MPIIVAMLLPGALLSAVLVAAVLVAELPRRWSRR